MKDMALSIKKGEQNLSNVKKNNQKLAALSGAMVALSVLPAQNLAAATVAVPMQAIIAASGIFVAANQSLNFGAFTEGGGGTVEVNTAGAPTYTGPTGSPSPAPTEGIVMVKGKGGGALLTMSVLTATVNVTNGTSAMAVNQFHLNTVAGGSTGVTRTMSASTIFIPVGATLTVNPNQPPGTYTGNFTVQVVYN